MWAFLGHCNCRRQGEAAKAFATSVSGPFAHGWLVPGTFNYLTLTPAVRGRQHASPFCRSRNRGSGDKHLI